MNPRLTDPLTLAFAEDVRRDLARRPKQLQPKYFYDALGSSLFEAICRLPWYRIADAESGLIARHRRQIVQAVMRGAVVELGCGKGEKLTLLAEAMRENRSSARVHLVDVSPQAIEATRDRIERLGFQVTAHEAAYQDGLQSATRARGDGPMLVLFLGSNIGNLDPHAARGFLRQIQSTCRPGDLLLLGVDLTKPEPQLILAYDDPLGVTAAFNKNVLVRINAELGADFDVQAFDHRAIWDPGAQRVEMHLVSTRRQQVRIPAADLIVPFEPGEHIWTESSYKYEPEQVIEMGRAVGFTVRQQWIDDHARFALTLFSSS